MDPVSRYENATRAAVEYFTWLGGPDERELNIPRPLHHWGMFLVYATDLWMTTNGLGEMNRDATIEHNRFFGNDDAILSIFKKHGVFHVEDPNLPEGARAEIYELMASRDNHLMSFVGQHASSWVQSSEAPDNAGQECLETLNLLGKSYSKDDNVLDFSEINELRANAAKLESTPEASSSVEKRQKTSQGKKKRK